MQNVEFMTQNLYKQLAASEKMIAVQNEMIDNQKKQIVQLEQMNSKLKKEVDELRSYSENLCSDYEEVVSMCKEQQRILNSLIKS